MGRVLTSALLALTGAALLAAPAQAGLLAPTSKCTMQTRENAPIAVQEQAMRCLHGYARRQARRQKLDRLEKLDTSATRKSDDILRCNQFSHDACGRDFLYWLTNLGYVHGCWTAGENIAWGSGELGDARSIMRAWLHSPGHKANLLSGSFSHFGISLRIGDLGGVNQAHVWVAHFGDHC